MIFFFEKSATNIKQENGHFSIHFNVVYFEGDIDQIAPSNARNVD